MKCPIQRARVRENPPIHAIPARARPDTVWGVHNRHLVGTRPACGSCSLASRPWRGTRLTVGDCRAESCSSSSGTSSTSRCRRAPPYFPSDSAPTAGSLRVTTAPGSSKIEPGHESRSRPPSIRTARAPVRPDCPRTPGLGLSSSTRAIACRQVERPVLASAGAAHEEVEQVQLLAP